MKRKIFNRIFKGALLFSFGCLVLIAIPYLTSPIYTFAPPKPFEGESYYNPYQQIDTLWGVGNFHAHSKSWGGFTNGKDPQDSIFSTYHDMGYTFFCLSNYQKTTSSKSNKIITFPTYEHGFNIKKRHHLCIGTDRVSWIDFFFCQTVHHKQFILDKLKPTTDFLVVNHPKFWGSFEESDFSKLSNYDAMELVIPFKKYTAHFDSALSSGYYTVLLGNDDMHDLSVMDEVGACFTVLNTTSDLRSDLIATLRAGKHYVVKAHFQPNENYETKKKRIAQLVHPQKISLTEDTLSVILDADVLEISFIGQNGTTKKASTHTNHAEYVFESSDTYIRIVLEDKNNNLYFFNPIVRSNDKEIINISRAEINRQKTYAKRTIIGTGFFLILAGIYYRKRKTYNQKMRIFLQKPYYGKLLLLMLISTLLRVLAGAVLELNNDEVYYRLYALYPDFSHFDHPPLLGWLIQIFTLNLYFDSAFFIRLAALVLGTANIAMVFRIGQKIKGNQTGFIAAVLFCISPYASLVAGTFILPDAPLLFFWLLALLQMVSVFEGEISPSKANRFLGLGLIIGLGVLSKYTAVFLWFGIGLYILFYRRDWLKKWQTYVSILISFCCCLPILYWNINNDFISFSFHGNRVGLFSEVDFSYFFTELLGELLYNNPFTFILTYIVLFGFIFKRNRQPLVRNPYNRLFICTGLPLLILFLLFSFFHQLLPHWNSPGYIALLFPIALYVSEKWDRQKKSLWIQAKIWSLLIVFLMLLFLVQTRMDIFRLKEKGIQDFSIELSSWEKTGKAFGILAQKAERQGEIKPYSPIVATKWFPAANLDMYVAAPNAKKLLAMGNMEKIHKYAWINRSRGGFWLGMDAWFITDDYNFDDPKQLAPYFEEISPADTIPIYRNGRLCKNVYIYKLKTLKSFSNSYYTTFIHLEE